jgi:hypothetical protein
MSQPDPLRQILELARWAPSGDNTQPWRFEIASPTHVVVHGFDTRDHCVYDLDGHPSQISLGALLETAAIAASALGLRMQAERRTDMPETRPTFDLHFHPDATLTRDPLVEQIERRSVQRRPLSSRHLTDGEKAQLDSALPSGYRLHWVEGGAAKWQAALLMFRSAKLRLTTPEAYQVHRDIIEWNCRHSTTKVPDQALGVDPATTRLMRFVLQSWGRVQFFNRFLAGTWAPRLQMDLLPGLRCAAHFALCAERAPRSIDDYVAAGRAMQRLWLQITAMDLLMQPEITPLVFARYAREGRKFSVISSSAASAAAVKTGLEQLLGREVADKTVYMGRVGAGDWPRSRSLRMPLADLLITQPSQLR